MSIYLYPGQRSKKNRFVEDVAACIIVILKDFRTKPKRKQNQKADPRTTELK